MVFSRQEYWNGLPFPTPRDLPYPGTEPASPALAGRFFTTEPSMKPNAQRGLSKQLILWLAYPKFTHNSSYMVHRLRSRQAPDTPLSKISGLLLWAVSLYSVFTQTSKQNQKATKPQQRSQGMCRECTSSKCSCLNTATFPTHHPPADTMNSGAITFF